MRTPVGGVQLLGKLGRPFPRSNSENSRHFIIVQKHHMIREIFDLCGSRVYIQLI